MLCPGDPKGRQESKQIRWAVGIEVQPNYPDQSDLAASEGCLEYQTVFQSNIDLGNQIAQGMNPLQLVTDQYMSDIAKQREKWPQLTASHPELKIYIKTLYNIGRIMFLVPKPQLNPG